MELTLKNVAMITNATIKIDGLTVIAGENDTGKSTIGKALFCAIKSSAISDGKFFYRNRDRYILDKLFNNLKNIISISSKNPLEYAKEAQKINEIKQEVANILKHSHKKDFKNRYLNAINKLKSDENIKNISLFDDIYNLLQEAMEDSFKHKFTANNFRTIMEYAFSNDYYPHSNNSKTLELIISDNIKNNRVKFKLTPQDSTFIGSKIFDDVVYIDTPVIFQLIKLLNDTALADKEYMPTIKDLKSKLLDLPKKREIWEQIEIQKIANYIQEVIGGDINNISSEIIYNKIGDSQPIKIENTATGVKSFGLILLLLKQGYINSKMVLILDEPEVHLHPKWQLKMAKLIIMLVKSGVTIIVNSHSPYMIEALKRYSEIENIANKTNFYLAEEGEIELQDTLERIFEKLAKPMNQLRELKWKSLK